MCVKSRLWIIQIFLFTAIDEAFHERVNRVLFNLCSFEQWAYMRTRNKKQKTKNKTKQNKTKNKTKNKKQKTKNKKQKTKNKTKQNKTKQKRATDALRTNVYKQKKRDRLTNEEFRVRYTFILPARPQPAVMAIWNEK